MDFITKFLNKQLKNIQIEKKIKSLSVATLKLKAFIC